MSLREIARELTPEPVRMLKRKMLRAIEGEIALKARYQHINGRHYDPSNIRTFSDKIFRRLIELNRNADQRFTRFADKFAVRDFVRDEIGERHLTKLIWHGTLKVPFDSLPAQCIIKTNHGCGGHIIYDPSCDRPAIVARLRTALSENYFWSMREYQYYDIKPRILIEELLDDGSEHGPIDYRFWCFHGNPEVIQVDNSAHNINPFYDLNWTKLPLYYRCNGAGDVERPANFEDMLSIASKLSRGFDFVRVDLYNIRGRVVFGEMTFTPVAGSFSLKPSEYDLVLGEKWLGR